MRQRWTVADPWKGYVREAHFWYTPEDIPIRKHKADNHIKQRDLKARKEMWPIATVSGRRLMPQVKF